MTAVRITAARARQLGLPGIPKSSTKKGRVRRTAPGPYHTQCVLCREEFRTRVGEDRHVEATGHPRYALVIGLGE